MSFARWDRRVEVALLALVPCAFLIASLAGSDGDDLYFDRERDAQAIAQRVEDSLRADRTYLRAWVAVRAPERAERLFEFESWNDRIENRAFVRVLSPASEAGEAVLDLPPNLWRYLVESERVERLLPAARLVAWMGSDFALEDILTPVRTIEAFDVALVEDAAAQRAAAAGTDVIEYTPRRASSAARGKIVAWVDAEQGVPTREEFYAPNGERLRTLTFSDVRVVGERLVPYRWTAISAAGNGSESVLDIRELRLDAAFDDRIFTTQNLHPKE